VDELFGFELFGFPIIFDKSLPRSGPIVLAPMDWDEYVLVKITCQRCGWSTQLTLAKVNVEGPDIQCPNCDVVYKLDQRLDQL